ncbi:hypothetical protein JTB14_029732 [Gonioctena quinquepunctata]|nr:hypothetical protein JTB14_029732 [Gonioctena quinquepunctata]
MCKCCQSCLESCYWNLIGERFCFDESIATYQEPNAKEEKNNNFFENMAFYDSVSVIAGRAIVTIDPLPEKEKLPILQQPRRLNRESSKKKQNPNEASVQRIPSFVLDRVSDEITAGGDAQDLLQEKEEPRKTVSFEDISSNKDEVESSLGLSKASSAYLEPPESVELRKKSLMERRTSKSLHLRIDFPKDMPIIRQSSVPKFFVDTPEENQAPTTLLKCPYTSLQSPMVCAAPFSYDLKSVVQIESCKRNPADCINTVPIHKEPSRLSHIKEKIKLKKSRSTVSSSNIPHTNYI